MQNNIRPASPPGSKYSLAGFTLLEILFVVAIIGILTTIVVPIYRSYLADSEMKVAINDIRAIDIDITLFYAENRRFPATLAEIGKDTLLDPWGNSYQYLNIADDSPPPGKMRKDRFLVPINSDYDLYSMGADGKSVTPLTSKLSQDDIIRANNGGFLGLGSDY